MSQVKGTLHAFLSLTEVLFQICDWTESIQSAHLLHDVSCQVSFASIDTWIRCMENILRKYIKYIKI